MNGILITKDTSLHYASDWREDFRNALKTSEQIQHFFGIDVRSVETGYKTFIPRPFAQKIKEAGPDSPLARQFLPSRIENHNATQAGGLLDPIADQKYSKGHGIIHRYHNRVLFTPTEICPVLCRYCFRKNELQQGADLFKFNVDQLKQYLQLNPQVEEVIFTGGDPLILSDRKIEALLLALSTIPTVSMVRFHSRTPVILPNRMTQALIDLLDRYAQHFTLLTLVIHTNHVSEWLPEFIAVLNRMRKTGINLLSQSVLLRDVNDEVEALKTLFTQLTHYGVRPYYLHHPDPTRGAMHFHIPLEEGRRIFKALKHVSSGVILPHYVIEQPEGGGKVLALC